MIRSGAARKLAAAALVGGGGAGLLGGTLLALLAAEALLAKRVIGGVTGEAPMADGVYGVGGTEGEPVSFVVLGDSSACGYGVHTPEETPGALLAIGLAALAGRPVRLTNVAMVGAESKHLAEQVERALPAEPDVALIIIGGNDVTHRTTPAEAVPLLVSAIEQLRSAGAEVVVGTCPDLGTIQPVAPPLRQIVRGWSRWLAQAQIEAAPKAGARVVALGSLLGPEFAAAPRELFGPDRFHPSGAGYASAAAAILPSLAAAAGFWPDDEDADSLSDGQLLAISFAAVPKPRAH
ncbi:SGNH/GDSL hydrolase family protein [Flindersiella endophytica]